MKPEVIQLVKKLEYEFLIKSGESSQVSIFLCGGAGKKEGELRRAIGDTIVKWRSKYFYSVHYPEDLFVELMLGHKKHDLLSLENILANSVNAVAIILHSPGTFAELGAFSNNFSLNQKLIIVIDSKYKKQRSFINLGPIRFLQTKTKSKVIYAGIDQNNLEYLADSIAEAAREISKTTSPHHNLTNPLAAYEFFLAAIYCFEPIPKSALMKLASLLRPEDEDLVHLVAETVINSLINERKILYNGTDLSITPNGSKKLLAVGLNKNRMKLRSDFLTEIRFRALNLMLRKYHPTIWEE